MGVKKEVETKNEGEKKSDGGGGGSTTMVMKFDMHCEGCAKKVRKSLKNFNGVETVKTESSEGKLTVVGKVDPVKIKEKVEEKIKKKVEIISLQQPNKPSNGGGEKKSDDGIKKGEEKKSEVKFDDKKKEEDKKEEKKPKEAQVATVLLKTRVHCEGCAQKIKKIVRKCDGVQDVNVDLQKDMIILKGTMSMKDLLPYLNVKLKRNVELAPAKKDDGGGGGGDKKPKEGDAPKDKPKEGGGGGGAPAEKPKEGGGGGGGSSEKPAKGGGEKKEGGEKKDGGGGGGGGDGSGPKENVSKIEVNKMEYNPYAYGYGAHAYTYDPRQQGESSTYYSHQVVDYWHEPEYSHPPQMFSDENPNACSVM